MDEKEEARLRTHERRCHECGRKPWHNTWLWPTSIDYCLPDGVVVAVRLCPSCMWEREQRLAMGRAAAALSAALTRGAP